MVRELVLQALAAAGVQHVEREPGLVRVYPHAALQELVGEEPWIELVFDEVGHHEYPGAALCIPGSFPLDRILALVQEMPRAYAFRAAPELPSEPPPGGPRLLNAASCLRPAGAEERTALRMLVRIRLQADETVEKLLWVAAAAGRERPDLLPAWDKQPDRSPLPHPNTHTPTHPDDLTALQHQAEHLAQELSEQYARTTCGRHQAERERLEGFHRALLEELPSQLPSGPAKRLAQARSEGLALQELLRSGLPGEGPWRRADLLPHGWWPLRRPGLLPDLDFETRLRVTALFSELPASFSREELDRAVEHHTQVKVERLLSRLRSDPEASRQLAEAEQRLQAEHAARLADLDRKLHLKTLVTPRALEAVTYPVAAYDLLTGGDQELRVLWDPLAGAWEPAACPACGQPASEFWLCSDGTLGCGACASRCSGCERVEPGTAPLPECSVCGSSACPACGRSCEECGGWSCGRHARRCEACEKTRCARYGSACGVCGAAACAIHPQTCSACGQPLCAEHHARCRVCEADLCPDHRVRCAICRHDACGEHQPRCRSCGQRYCARCVPGGTCETCRTLEPAGEATTSALRSQVAASIPGLNAARLQACRLGRNGHYLVVTARAWPYLHCFVFAEETGALLEHRRTWKPL